MSDLTTLNCPSCGNQLQITGDIERFACRHCGAALLVTRGDDGGAAAQVVRPGVANGQEHTSQADLSPEARRAYAQIMQTVFADADHDGVPDILQTAGGAVAQATTPAPAASPSHSRWRLGGGLSGLFGLFWCCVFPLFFILPPLLSDSGKCAIATAQDNARVIRELGQPVRPIFPLTFSYSSEGAVTQEQYLIVLNGPKGFGFLLISGYQNPVSERLEVEFNKDGHSYLIYDGPRDCSRNTIR